MINRPRINARDGKKGTPVWLVRVQVKGKGKAKVCHSREAAREAEAALLRELKEPSAPAAPPPVATLRDCFDTYVATLERHGKESAARRAPGPPPPRAPPRPAPPPPPSPAVPRPPT